MGVEGEENWEKEEKGEKERGKLGGRVKICTSLLRNLGGDVVMEREKKRIGRKEKWRVRRNLGMKVTGFVKE